MKKRVFLAAPAAPDITKLDQDRLRKLLQLCHPDRHANSPLSTETFGWLLDVRKELDKKKEGG